MHYVSVAILYLVFALESTLIKVQSRDCRVIVFGRKKIIHRDWSDRINKLYFLRCPNDTKISVHIHADLETVRLLCDQRYQTRTELLQVMYEPEGRECYAEFQEVQNGENKIKEFYCCEPEHC
ncbi:hypothetical protein FGIG_04863 [Fasciola gigantica]|uniref:Uncharacterized protein n=1 Tax=Fasciola gigantica TaxID=46835 RepID=A0A504YBZ8_FASGI|nr:hypothetical protein FGIG_04863 [Fasciola gigantica]